MSSNISEIGYGDGLLRVRFKNGNLYEYKGVTTETYDKFKSSPSKGKFFITNIRVKGEDGADKYPFTKILEGAPSDGK